MRKVAKHLEVQALAIKDPDGRDKFARSSFNRYYYATFLKIRETLSKINPNWVKLKHSDVPDLLRKTLMEKFRNRAKLGVMKRDNSNRLLSNANTAASSLASLIAEGKQTRVVADYDPETAVCFDDSIISLNGVKIGTAASWPERADRSCGIILDVAEKFGLR